MESDDIKRHFTVLTEHLDSKIALLAEGQAALGDRLSRRIDSLEKRMKEDSEETRALIRFPMLNSTVEFRRSRPTYPSSGNVWKSSKHV